MILYAQECKRFILEIESQHPHSNVAKCATLEWGTRRR